MTPGPRVIVAAASTICLALSCASPPEPAPEQRSWSLTGSMNVARAEHSGTLLPSGQVLVTGGLDHFLGGDAGEWTCLSSAELYDPATGSWADAGSMLGPRCTRGLFPISKGPYAGKVLVASGIASYYQGIDDLWFHYRLLSTTELFDPTSGTWSSGPPMLEHSVGFVQLADGKLLAVGSFVNDPQQTPSPDVQIFDPAAPQPAWQFVQPLNEPRANPALVLLDGGEVLVIAGLTNHSPNLGSTLSRTAERYDPTADQWRSAAPPPSPRWDPVLIRLPNGNVLYTAGCPWPGGCDDPQPVGVRGPSNEAWIYEPARDVWRPTSPMHYPRVWALGTLLNSGKVLVASGNWKRISDGGQADYNPAPVPEIFDPTTETWSTTDAMPHYTSCCGAMVKLQSGDVLFAGGYTNGLGDMVPGISSAQVFRESR